MSGDSSELSTNQLVYIKNGIIDRIEPDSGQIVIADHSINGNGKYLIPGLIDAHAHYFDVKDLPQTIAFGVTSVRVMMGFPMQLRWRKAIERGDIIGPTMVLGTPTFNAGDDVGPFQLNVDKMNDVSSKIEMYKEEGYDFVKIYSGLNEAQVSQIFDAARSYDIQVAGHLPDVANIYEFLEKGPLSIEHMEVISELVFDNEPDSVGMAELAEKLIQEHVSVVPTLVVIRNNVRVIEEGRAFASSYKELANPLVAKMFAEKRVNKIMNASEGLKNAFIKEDQLNRIILKELYKHGVNIVAGTDSGPIYTVNGLSLLEELELYVDTGFSPYEALKTATKNAASLLRLEKIGEVKQDFGAELLLLNANPLEDISAIHNKEAVITKDKYFDAETLNRLLILSKDKTGYFRTIVRLLEQMVFR
jgi:imidazolonepropionase-like amidohydrolase